MPRDALHPSWLNWNGAAFMRLRYPWPRPRDWNLVEWAWPTNHLRRNLGALDRLRHGFEFAGLGGKCVAACGLSPRSRRSAASGGGQHRRQRRRFIHRQLHHEPKPNANSDADREHLDRRVACDRNTASQVRRSFCPLFHRVRLFVCLSPSYSHVGAQNIIDLCSSFWYIACTKYLSTFPLTHDVPWKDVVVPELEQCHRKGIKRVLFQHSLTLQLRRNPSIFSLQYSIYGF